MFDFFRNIQPIIFHVTCNILIFYLEFDNIILQYYSSQSEYKTFHHKIFYCLNIDEEN